MPRSGGDNVFRAVCSAAQSIPGRDGGFALIMQGVALAGGLLASLGVATLFLGLGVY